MTVARAKGKLRGRQPKLSPKPQAELRRMHASGDYTIADLAELFAVSRPTVYCTVQRSQPKQAEVSPAKFGHIRPNFPEYYGNPDLERPGRGS